MAEFRELVAQVDELELKLELASAHHGQQYTALEALQAAQEILEQVSLRTGVFEKRASEKDPDKKIYGPKMVGRVMELVGRVNAAAEGANELNVLLAPQRKRQLAEEEQHRQQCERDFLEEHEQHRLDSQQGRLAEHEARVENERALQQKREETRAEIAVAMANARRGEAAVAVTHMTLDKAILLLEENCGPQALGEALQALLLICSNVVAHPDESQFRSIRLTNPHFQLTVARHCGGLEALHALGFAEVESLDEGGNMLVLEEPSLEKDMEAWAAWFERLKTQRSKLQAHMQSCNVAPLPTAVKSVGVETLNLPA